MKLSGKVALVTGGSRGIGKEIAKTFLKEGAKVSITSKDFKRLEKTAVEFGNIFFVAGDVRIKNDVDNVVSKTLEKFGKIDILVNNAGIFPDVKPLHEISDQDWNQIIEVNLTGQFRFTRAVIPTMKKNGGVIINIASNAGLKAFENFEADAYTAAKGALVLLTKAWAIEYAKFKIRVNCICPGIVETDMTAPFLISDSDREMAVKEHPIGRIGTVDDVAKAVLHFASDDSSWNTGTILPLDGGASIR